MSRAAKITFAVSCILSATTVIGVHFIQGMEREALHQGPIKDAKRMAEKREREEQLAQSFSSSSTGSSAMDDAKARKRERNRTEHEQQQELRRQYESQQPLTGEIVTQGGEKFVSTKPEP